MNNASELSSRRSEFVSVRLLVQAIASAESRSEPEIAKQLWNLLAEAGSPPAWLHHDAGVTSHLEQRAHGTGWFALRALRDGRECPGSWDSKIGFSLEELRTFFEAKGMKMPALGVPSDFEILRKRLELKTESKFNLRTAEYFGISVDQVRNAVRRAAEAEKPDTGTPSSDPFRRTSTPYYKKSDR